MESQGNRSARCRHTVHKISRVIARKGKHRLDLDILGKGFGVLQIEGTTTLIQGIVSLIPVGDSTRDVSRVAQEEISCIDQQAVFSDCHDIEPPVHRRRKGIFYRLPLQRIVTGSAVLIIGLH